MANLRQWIESAAAGETIEGVVFSEGFKKLPSVPLNKVIPWYEAKVYADYDFNTGFGTAGCHSITAWTTSKVIFVSEYDGSTRINHVPRNPVAHTAKMC